VFASTIDVYAMHAVEQVIDEKSPAGAWGLYGASKLFCEQLVDFYAKLYGCGHSILRYGHIFGPGEESYEKLIPSMIRRLLHQESPVIYGDGSAERDYLYVEDAVEATIRAAVSDKKKIGPVNIVRGASTPIRKIAELLVRLTDFNGQITYLKDKSNGHSLRFDNNLMRQLLETWCFIGLEEGLKHEVNHAGGLVHEKR
jgi:nucleoside-diphosphate-sugar epimerase